MKKVFGLILSMLLMMSILAEYGVAAGKVYTIKLANMLADDHPESQAMFKFKELAEAKSKGQLKVEVYPNSQLGAAESYNDSLILGTIQMALPGTVIAQNFPNAAIPECPFLFRNWAHARKVLTGPVGDKIHEGMQQKIGVRCLGMIPVSFRVITSNKKLEKFEDFKGFRLRVPNIPFYIEFAKGIGANPITMNFSELFTSLEQKVVDGQENPYTTIKVQKLYEVQKYILDSRHIFTSHGWYVNERFYQSLPDNLKKIVNQSVKQAVNYCFDLSIKEEQESIKFIQKKGVTIIYPDAKFRKQLRDSQKSTREFFYKTYPDSKGIIERIEKVK
jgi:tripartite ATP-independent transporter DctP family solute receptor